MFIHVNLGNLGGEYKDIFIPAGQSSAEFAFSEENKIFSNSCRNFRDSDFTKPVKPVVNCFSPAFPVDEFGPQVKKRRVLYTFFDLSGYIV